MPPFHSRSTGALRIALSRSFGDICCTSGFRPSTARTSGEIGIDFTLRGHTPPPAEISDLS